MNCTLVYKARLTQTGPNPPIATVIRNDFSTPIVWTRMTDGVYKGTSSVGWRKEKTVIFVNASAADSPAPAGAIVSSDTEIFLILGGEDGENVFNVCLEYNPAI